MDRITVQDIEQVNFSEDMKNIALPHALTDDNIQPVNLNNDHTTIVFTSDAEPSSNPGEAKKKTKMKLKEVY